jgi:drug/metabolite transporter (DMT)-like permease
VVVGIGLVGVTGWLWLDAVVAIGVALNILKEGVHLIWLSSQGGQVSRRQWLGLLLGFVGLAMVVSRKLEGGIEVTPWSLTMAVMALCAITIGTLYQKRFVQLCDVRSANAVQLMAAFVVTLPIACLEVESVRWTHEMMGALAWSVIGLTLGGSSLFYLLIQRGAAASVTSLMYLVPPTTAVMAWFLFDEPITAVTLAGIAVTALGVSLVVRTPRVAS